MNLRKIPLTVLPAVLLASAVLFPVSASAANSCESLSSLVLPHTTITLAQSVAAGTFTLPGGRGRPGQQNEPLRDLPAFCRVAAALRPASDSDIKMEVWMPLSNWNGKYLAVGNGGWAGSISYPAMVESLRRGYATSSTDTGHSTPGGSFALGHPEKFIDFAYRQPSDHFCFFSLWRLPFHLSDCRCSLCRKRSRLRQSNLPPPLQSQQRHSPAHCFQLAVRRTPVQPLAYSPRQCSARQPRLTIDRLLNPCDHVAC